MTLDLDNMTQAEFDEVMTEIKEERPNLFQFIADFVDRKVSTEEVDEYLKMKREKTSGIYQELSSEGIKKWLKKQRITHLQ